MERMKGAEEQGQLPREGAAHCGGQTLAGAESRLTPCSWKCSQASRSQQANIAKNLQGAAAQNQQRAVFSDILAGIQTCVDQCWPQFQQQPQKPTFGKMQDIVDENEGQMNLGHCYLNL